MYRIKLTPIAAENIRKCNPRIRDQLIRKIEILKKEPIISGKPLQGPLKGLRVIRAVGQRYRIIYRVLKNEIVVVILAVGIRKEGDKRDIYKLMKKYIKTGLLGE